MIETYSLKENGSKKLSRNFKVSEFACPGTDEVLIDSLLVNRLQQLRDLFGRPVHIRSGYRTAAYNKVIGGDPYSHHLYGQAADIDIGDGPAAVPAKIVAMAADAIGIQRIGCYVYANGQSWDHIGSRPEPNKWMQTAPGIKAIVKTFIPVLRRQYGIVRKSENCVVVQTILSRLGFYTGPIDGKFGPLTQRAVKAFQAEQKIIVDGIVGPITWRKLFEKGGKAL